MFIKRIVFILITLVHVQILTAQELNIKWGGYSRGDNAIKNKFKAVGWSEDNYYAISSQFTLLTSSYSIYLEKISKDMRVSLSKELSYSHKYNLWFHPVIIDKELHILGTKWGKKSSIFYTEKYDLNGRPKGFQELASYPLKYIKYQNAGHDYSESPDKKRMAIVQLSSGKKGEAYKLVCLSMKKDGLGKAETREYAIHEGAYELKLMDQQVDNMGNIVILVAVQQEKDKETAALVHSYIVNAKGELKGGDILEYSDYYFGDPKLTVTKTGKVKIGGLYYLKEKKRAFYHGMFITDFDIANQAYSNLQVVPFSEELMLGYGKKIKDGTVKLQGAYEVKVIEDESGGGYVIAERLYQVASNNAVYAFNMEMLVSGFSADNKMAEVKMLLKGQRNLGNYAHASGYHAFTIGEVLYLLFNDRAGNQEVKALDDINLMIWPRKEEAVTMLATVDKSANIENKIWFWNEKEDGYFIPGKAYTEEDKKIIGIAKGKQIRYGLIVE